MKIFNLHTFVCHFSTLASGTSRLNSKIHQHLVWSERACSDHTQEIELF